MDTCNIRKPLPLFALNHVSRTCSDLEASYKFYTEVLGFMQVKRPSSFEFEGAWLFNYGMGLHLHLIKGCPPSRPSEIEPKSCHISFQAVGLEEVELGLQAWGIPYVKNAFVEEGIQVGQLFFHDPDNNMIEVCNCDQLPVIPLSEGALAYAARQLTAAAGPRPLPVPVPGAQSEAAALGSGADSDDNTASACSAGPTSFPCAATASEAGSAGRRSSSFSNSSVSGAAGLDLSAMSTCTADLDDWLASHGGGAQADSGGSVGCTGVGARVDVELRDKKCGATARDGAVVVSVHAVSAASGVGEV